MDFFADSIQKLGFGTMRLPQLENGDVDKERVCGLFDTYLEKGYCYFDTAYFYHNGQSEEAIRDCLIKRHPRESFILADKMPMSVLKEEQENHAEEIFNLQKTRTGAEYFDMYLLHALDDEYAEKAERMGIWEYLLKKKEAGEIRHLGFSFHDTAAVLDKILTAHPEAEFVQLQLNYADWEDKKIQSQKCYEVCVKHNKPVVVMEPVKGGLLASEKGAFAPILKEANGDASLAGWAFRFVGSLPQVKMILSGMSDEAQVAENVELFAHLAPLTEQEQEVITKARQAIVEAGQIGCTACRYCVNGCPEGIEIPRILSVLNGYKRYGSLERAKGQYAYATKNGGKASQCHRCGRCEGVCPQHLYISGYMEEAAKLFE